jgi:uncharacterized protein with PIN domain
MAVDTSALLAVFFAESTADWVAARLSESTSPLCMSTVNLTETLIRVRDQRPESFAEIEETLLNSGIRFVPPDVEQARIVAEADRPT